MDGDTRLWMYRKGEARLFGHPDHVPVGESWQRFPQAEGEADKAAVRGSSTRDEDIELSQEQKLERMSRKRLMQVAADCGVRFGIGWTKAELKQAIIEVLNDNGA
jgi:hypothetical protein